MIIVSNTNVSNFEGAIRGMRNPKKSWEKSDSYYDGKDFVLGENDYNLAMRLVRAGSDHRKFLRQIHVSMDIDAPLYWWKQFSTYKVGTVANSTSTMHTLMDEKLTVENFAWNKMTGFRKHFLNHLNTKIKAYQIAEDGERKEELFREIIQNLPQSFIYLRTVTLNYEVLRNIYHSRKYHKLREWHRFCGQIEELPYSQLITAQED